MNILETINKVNFSNDTFNQIKNVSYNFIEGILTLSYSPLITDDIYQLVLTQIHFVKHNEPYEFIHNWRYYAKKKKQPCVKNIFYKLTYGEDSFIIRTNKILNISNLTCNEFLNKIKNLLSDIDRYRLTNLEKMYYMEKTYDNKIRDLENKINILRSNEKNQEYKDGLAHESINEDYNISDISDMSNISREANISQNEKTSEPTSIIEHNVDLNEKLLDK